MNLRLLFLAVLFAGVAHTHAVTYSKRARTTIGSSVLMQIEAGIQAQRAAGHQSYSPAYVFVVDPSKQRMYVLDRGKKGIVKTLRCGTGKKGLGIEDGQTPTGFFTMGGVRIAKNADTSIQTGDTKKGVSGIYAELLYPPSFPDAEQRGRVPNGVVIHSYNPKSSSMLRERRAKRLIGRVPCTMGCPVPEIEDVKKLLPYLKGSAGQFDPDARPNAALRSLIKQGKVKQYANKRLGAGIFIMGGETGQP
ncbi:MAG: L,D-transpeptidase [Verrucomicrobiales bacterium]|nr:L,D-transpeptidase [Verrucomicrobiales bacterium]